MKLNLHIIGDALAIEKSKIISDSNIEMELVNVRLLPDDPRQCGDQYLYLIDHQLSEAYLQIEKLSLIILNDNGANLKINHSWNVILMAKMSSSGMFLKKCRAFSMISIGGMKH